MLKNQEVENIVENTSEENETSISQEAITDQEREKEISNNLEEFGVNTSEPDLFSNENIDMGSDDLTGLIEKDDDEDDLEIPAFLRRQKN